MEMMNKCVECLMESINSYIVWLLLSVVVQELRNDKCIWFVAFSSLLAFFHDSVFFFIIVEVVAGPISSSNKQLTFEHVNRFTGTCFLLYWTQSIHLSPLSFSPSRLACIVLSTHNVASIVYWIHRATSDQTKAITNRRKKWTCEKRGKTSLKMFTKNNIES